tara:strand:- start:3102 stop:4517 length:1416 start_codon:yes stop_codon:yes gene_type:complete
MSFTEDFFVFYDTETTGLDINFSQIIQVGCVLTDNNFNILEELNLSSKVLPWIVPSPDAFLVHRQTDCLEEGVSHYEMMKSLREKWLSWGRDKNLIFVTYNGHKFDEELVRRQFYWNLFDPYITNTNGNKRLDLMSLFQIIGNFYPTEIKIPEDEDENISLKLTDLAKENNIPTENAHDAVIDCMLMVNLMKKIKASAPEALIAAIKGSSKTGNIELTKTEPFSILGEIFRKKKYIYPVIACGQNPNQANQVALIDLYFDPKKMFEMTDYELSEQFGAGGGLKKISVNKSIPIMPVDRIKNINNFLDSPFELLESRAKQVAENLEFQNRVCEVMTINQREYPPNKYLEQKVYERFPSNSDKLWMERFEISTWAEKAKLLSGFEDERYRELSQRLINYLKPEFSSNKEKDNFHEFIKERLLTNGPWKMTLEKAISRTNSLRIDAEENKENEKLKIIDLLLQHYQQKKILSEL